MCQLFVAIHAVTLCNKGVFHRGLVSYRDIYLIKCFSYYQCYFVLWTCESCKQRETLEESRSVFFSREKVFGCDIPGNLQVLTEVCARLSPVETSRVWFTFFLPHKYTPFVFLGWKYAEKRFFMTLLCIKSCGIYRMQAAAMTTLVFNVNNLETF